METNLYNRSSFKNGVKVLLSDLFNSKVKVAVTLCIVKASNYSIEVSPRRIARVYGLNVQNTYRFFSVLEKGGIIARKGRGYALRKTSRAKRFRELVLELINDLSKGGKLDLFRMRVPDTHYYITLPSKHFKEWFGVSSPLVVVDKRLKEKIGSPEDINIVYMSLRAKKFKFDWSEYLSFASPEQAFADVFSYDDNYISYVHDFLWNLSRLNLDEVLNLTNSRGLKIISTLLSYYALLTGAKIPLRVKGIERFIERDIIDTMLSVATSAIVPDNVALEKNV